MKLQLEQSICCYCWSVAHIFWVQMFVYLVIAYSRLLLQLVTIQLSLKTLKFLHDSVKQHALRV